MSREWARHVTRMGSPCHANGALMGGLGIASGGKRCFPVTLM
uniref:Uncharacterized protein n=1 Tax=Romanomermis culicivorax TaxID=13658 RepID=A0A915HFC9_ROMCU